MDAAMDHEDKPELRLAGDSFSAGAESTRGTRAR